MRLKVALTILTALTCGTLWAQEPAAYCARNPFHRDTAEPLSIGLTDWHGEQCRDCEFARAGCPQTLRNRAAGPNPLYWGYWIGGGTAVGGGPPCQDEGTWGWDFEGWPTRRVGLN